MKTTSSIEGALTYRFVHWVAVYSGRLAQELVSAEGRMVGIASPEETRELFKQKALDSLTSKIGLGETTDSLSDSDYRELTENSAIAIIDTPEMVTLV